MTLDSWLCEPVGMSLIELNKDRVCCAASGETLFISTPSTP